MAQADKAAAPDTFRKSLRVNVIALRMFEGVNQKNLTKVLFSNSKKAAILKTECIFYEMMGFLFFTR
jgi:hypothetical protein